MSAAACSAQAQPTGQPTFAPFKVSSMILRMVRAHRPHWALHPRQPYTWLVDRRDAALAALRTSWSLNTLQEQTIIRHPVGVFANPECR